ncbi:hypothetical protein JHK84_052440 [Glycine max]|nr:hypothetical protein JHK86_052400 [Glycine max]KAG5082402.1 hypothetical protein JHK84_052440 [Glycine max]
MAFMHETKVIGSRQAPLRCYSIQPDDVDDSSRLKVHLNQGVVVHEEQGFVHGKTRVINDFFVTNSCYIVDLDANGTNMEETREDAGPTEQGPSNVSCWPSDFVEKFGFVSLGS